MIWFVLWQWFIGAWMIYEADYGAFDELGWEDWTIVVLWPLSYTWFLGARIYRWFERSFL